jgi:hypothetical protein
VDKIGRKGKLGLTFGIKEVLFLSKMFNSAGEAWNRQQAREQFGNEREI